MADAPKMHMVGFCSIGAACDCGEFKNTDNLEEAQNWARAHADANRPSVSRPIREEFLSLGQLYPMKDESPNDS